MLNKDKETIKYPSTTHTAPSSPTFISFNAASRFLSQLYTLSLLYVAPFHFALVFALPSPPSTLFSSVTFPPVTPSPRFMSSLLPPLLSASADTQQSRRARSLLSEGRTANAAHAAVQQNMRGGLAWKQCSYKYNALWRAARCTWRRTGWRNRTTPSLIEFSLQPHNLFSSCPSFIYRLPQRVSIPCQSPSAWLLKVSFKRICVKY